MFPPHLRLGLSLATGALAACLVGCSGDPGASSSNTTTGGPLATTGLAGGDGGLEAGSGTSGVTGLPTSTSTTGTGQPDAGTGQLDGGGDAATSGGSTTGGPGPGCDADRPAIAMHPGGDVLDPQPAGAPITCATPTGIRAPHNTSLTVTEEGTVLFAPALTTGVIRSVDQGATWSAPLNNPPPAGEPGDWYHPWVTRDPVTGKLFFTTYESMVGTCGDGTGHHYWTSTDDGATWVNHPEGVGCQSWDWGKIVFGPPVTQASRDALEQSGYPHLVYFCAGGDLWALGPRHFCYRSTDGGETFTRTAGSPTNLVAIPSRPGWPNAGSIAPDGTFYKVFNESDGQGVTVAISDDEAESWRYEHVTDSKLSSGTGLNFLAVNVATDSDGNVYVVWVDDRDLLPYLSISTDGGATWSPKRMVGAPEVRAASNINIAAFAPGYIAIDYYGSPDATAPGGDGYFESDDRHYNGYITATADVFADPPVFWSTSVNDPAEPTVVGLSVGNSEYIGPPILGPDGSIWAAFLQGENGLAGRMTAIPR